MSRFGKLLVAFDGSPDSHKAVNFALEIARQCKAESRELHFLSVVHPPEQAELVEVEAVIDTARANYQELFNELRHMTRDLEAMVFTEVAVGHPAFQIARYAEERGCDLVVVGRRGRSKIEEWFLGSVSKRVAAYAPCTVVIAK